MSQAEPVEISRGEALALASQACCFCYGLGVCAPRSRVCNCVWRAIFRACYTRFRKCADADAYVSRINYARLAQPRHGQSSSRAYSRPAEEYLADFVLLARRTLRGNKLQLDLFRFHFLLGADWRLCSRKLNLDKGELFHEVYRVQQKLGRAYATCSPYALFPVDEYFTPGAAKREPVAAFSPRAEAKPVRAPLKQAAA